MDASAIAMSLLLVVCGAGLLVALRSFVRFVRSQLQASNRYEDQLRSLTEHLSITDPPAVPSSAPSIDAPSSGTPLSGAPSPGTQSTDIRPELLRELDAALVERRICAWFQPIVSVESGSVIGWEALARWYHPPIGMVPPDVFLPLVRATGRMETLTRRMLDDAVDFIGELIDTGQAGVARVHVNVDPSQLDRELLGRLRDLLVEHDLGPGRIVIEVTGPSIIALDQEAVETMRALQDLGIEIAIELGGGHSSLRQLLDVPIDIVKIDRRFISDLPGDHRSVAVVECVMGIATALGHRTVAVGVEHREQLELLTSLGCECYQGMVESPALPAVHAQAWLSNRRLLDTSSPARR